MNLLSQLLGGLSALDPLNLLSRLPGGAAQGILWGVMALGVYITFRLLDIADLTVDGSFTTGGAVTVMLILSGRPAWQAMLAAMLAGLLAGLVTGLLHTRLGIPVILSGILTQFALYSINLRIMGRAANKALSVDQYGLFWTSKSRGTGLLLSSRNVPAAIAAGLLLSAALVCALYWYFGTEQGSALRATGSNPAMARAQGIDIDRMKVLGLTLSNGIVALAGGLMAQYQGFADINMGRGSIVIGLAAVVIGEVLAETLLRGRLNYLGRFAFLIVGGVVYYAAVVVVLWLRLDTNDLKLFTAVIVTVFLAVPYLRRQAKTSFSLAGKRGMQHA